MYGMICVWLCAENAAGRLSLIEINCQELSTVIESKVIGFFVETRKDRPLNRT